MGDAADLNRSVLVYHRGAGVDTANGLFVMEKVRPWETGLRGATRRRSRT